MKKKFYWLSLEYYDTKTNNFYGDMGFAFEDSGDTINPSFEALRISLVDYLPEAMKYHEDDIKDGTIVSYYIMEGIFDLSEDDPYPYSTFDCRKETEKKVFKIAYCSEEDGKKYGIDADVYADPVCYL